MGSYLYCPKCSEYLGSLGGDSCSCGWEEVPFDEPQQRAWVGLTVEEANKLWESTDSDWELMKRVEAKLKEKNT